MSAFELKSDATNTTKVNENCIIPTIKNESLIAFKVYDSCRSQVCLTEQELNRPVVTIPPDAVSVTISNANINNITIVNKAPSQFKKGFWDVDIQYTFVYELTFRKSSGETIGTSTEATSTYSKKVSLFGSNDSDLVMATDLSKIAIATLNSLTFTSSPFILVEGKAIALAAQIKSDYVSVTIGLFTIIKLYRLVTLDVQSTGFSFAEKCTGVTPINPCGFFNSLDFPMDSFAPPQKPEFNSGISLNIPSDQ